MRKYSILSILPILVMTVSVLAPLPTSASVACPAGLICTPIPGYVTGCPTGYACVPNSSSSNASNTASALNALSYSSAAASASTSAGFISGGNRPSTYVNPSDYTTFTYYPSTPKNSTSGQTCSTELSFETAHSISKVLQLSSTQQASLISNSTLHVKQITYNQRFTTADSYSKTISTSIKSGSFDAGPNAQYLFDLCLDSGYVSNVPTTADANRIIGLNSTSTVWVQLDNPGYINTGIVTSKTYNVSVNYDKFTTEAAANGYVDVYDSTGTKTVSITVFNFPINQSISASSAIAQLSGLGYRPATLDEIYALNMSRLAFINADGIVGLGTLLTGGLYPYTASNTPGASANGLKESTGPFDTGIYMFAAVHK